MNLEGKTKEEIADYKNTFINTLKNQAKLPVGNISLVKALSATQEHEWRDNNNELYWIIRDLLMDDGLVSKGAGKGGSVDLIRQSEVDNSGQDISPESLIQAENELYGPIMETILNFWIKDERFDFCIGEITAKQGKRDTGGSWTRPDITVVGTHVYQFLPSKFLDVITFEIKPFSAINITVVYEALAHRRAATKSFIWLECPSDKRESNDFVNLLVKIERESKKHGIGVIVASDPSDIETWETLIDAEREEPDPGVLNDFINTQISEGTKQDIIKNVR